MDFNGFVVDKKDPIAAKFGSETASLYKEYTSASLSLLTTGENFQSRNSMMRVIDDKVPLDFVATTKKDADDLLAKLEKLGLTDGSVYGRYVSGMFPIAAIGSAADLNSLKFARTATATTNVGSVTSQADVAMRADVARSSFGVDGTGVTVGALSDSYNNLGGANDDVASGDLPGVGNPLGNTTPVNVLEDLPSGGIDEGRGMLQLIHDVAPGADLAFHTAFLGQANFANGIIELADEAGANVVVDDIIYFAEPMFQDGIIAQAVDQVVADGTAYFSSAGNNARNSYESAFNSSGVVIPGIGEFHDFDPGIGVDVLQSITVPVGSEFTISFQWDSPFFSVSGGAGSPNDLDIFLFDEFGNFLFSSDFNNIGNDPVEIFGFENDGTFGTEFNLAISNFAGPNPDLLKYVLFGNSTTINEYDTNSSTTYGHSNAAGAEAVGAAFYQETPEFGVNPPLLEPFSSAGGTPILFDTDGNRLAEPEIREKPEIVAPDGTNTTFFPPFPGQDVEGEGFPNFFGTSAAAPHAAAVAALMLEAVPDASPDLIYETLEQTALDMDDAFTPGFDEGFDFATGFGLIQADAAIAQLIDTPIDDEAIEGTDESESLFGTDDDDVIRGKGGDDEIFGAEGNNRLFGDAGNDTIYGGSGDDTISGGEDDDTIFAAEGDNRVSGNFGNDLIYTGSGNDFIVGGSGNDTIYGAEGNNRVFGNDENDLIYTGSGNDFIFSGSGEDTIYASEGDNQVFGDSGNDLIYTGSGDDEIEGGLGDDTIYAGEGDNIVFGDNLFGDSGNDLIYTGSGDDTIVGGSGDDTIYGAEGNNLVFGDSGNDLIYTGSGNDTIEGGSGNDSIWLGGGNDTVALAAFEGVDTINNFQLGKTTFELFVFEENLNEVSIADGINGAEISLSGELLAIASGVSASTLEDNFDSVFSLAEPVFTLFG
ncbi:MAG: S8 family serine peptidase [Cyanobacteriota bacterium]|nr:S8 family serine peptidase [Cyanobacteriota bacterium]